MTIHKRASSSLTSKFQATVPKAVREILQLEQRDKLIYEIKDDNTVLLRKATPLDIDYLNGLTATLSEWTSEEDDKAYNHL